MIDQLNFLIFGMILLLVFAVFNIVSHLILKNKVKDPKIKYFLQMNFFWNIINLIISFFAIYQNLATQKQSELKIAEYLRGAGDILFINTFLDVGYMLIALGLLIFGLKKLSSRFLGYSFSIFLQGLFLFFLDLKLFIQIRSWGY
jgi:hypothetical protein